MHFAALVKKGYKIRVKANEKKYEGAVTHWEQSCKSRQ